MSRLRTFITGLAVTGRLEEQDFSEAAPEEAQRLAQQSSSSSGLPKSWVGAQLGDLLDVTYGKGLPAGERAASGPVAVYGSNGVVSYTSHSMENQAAIIVGRKGSAGALHVAEGPSWTTDVAYYIVPPSYFDIGFLFLQLKALRLEGLSKGVKPGLSRSDMTPLQLAVPPLSEQARIVSKVQELMGFCDELEIAQRECELQRDALRSVSLYQLTVKDQAATPTANVRFFLDKSPRLITKPDHVAPIRQAILDLAVRGRLVPQDPADEPAAKLLLRLRSRANGSVAGYSKSQSEPFHLPTGWEWARFPELGQFGRGKSKHRPRNDPVLYADGLHPFIQTGDVARSGGVIRTFSTLYNDIGLAQSQMWPAGTLCITIAANIADTGVLTFDACFPDSVVGLIVSSEFPNCRYFEYFLRTAKADLHSFAPSTAQKNINLSILGDVMIPLPPLEELNRIVARVDELMAVCDELESALESAQTERGRLLEALLQDALAETSRTEASIEAVV